MDTDHDNVRVKMEEDRLSSLPDDIIHLILSYIDFTYVVQTSSLSSRWKFVWTSMPYLRFSSGYFSSLPKFAKFVTNVLSRRNNQVEVSSVKLHFHGAASQVFVRKIANYAFSHNVQELTIQCLPKNHYEYPPCLFSSHSLKNLTLSTRFLAPCITPKSPWDFPALTTLHLSDITLCDNSTDKSFDIFSKCVNLKNLTLNRFFIKAVEVFDIIAPQLASLTLIDGRACPNVINLIAPQLENLTMSHCHFEHLGAPPGLSSLFYSGYCPPQFSADGFHSLSEVHLYLSIYCSHRPYEEEDAKKTVNLLQELHSVKFLTLNTEIVECLSAFPDQLSRHPSPFANLKSLKIEYKGFMARKDSNIGTMSAQVKNYFLQNSPSATFTMELPEKPPTKSMKQKEARAKKKAKQSMEVETLLTKLQVLLERGKMQSETMKAHIEQGKALIENHKSEEQVQTTTGSINTESEKARFMGATVPIKNHITEMQIDQGNAQDQKAQIGSYMAEMQVQLEQKRAEVINILSHKCVIKSSLEKLPKRQRAEVETRYSCQLEESDALCSQIFSDIVVSQRIMEDCQMILSANVPTLQDAGSRTSSSS